VSSTATPSIFTSADPDVEVSQFVLAESVLERQHGNFPNHRPEGLHRFGSHPLRGRFEVEKFGVGLLEPLKLPEQGIVVGIGNLGSVIPVVALVVVPDPAPQFLDAGFGRATGHPGVPFGGGMGKDFDTAPGTIIQWKRRALFRLPGKMPQGVTDEIILEKARGGRTERSR
jgi:hypothetical protein